MRGEEARLLAVTSDRFVHKRGFLDGALPASRPSPRQQSTPWPLAIGASAGETAAHPREGELLGRPRTWRPGARKALLDKCNRRGARAPGPTVRLTARATEKLSSTKLKISILLKMTKYMR
jgi:hypothetical protein